jgi:hypothetical protein
MLRKAVCGLAVVALGASLMYARQESVSPNGDRVYADAPPQPDSPEAITAEVRQNLKTLNDIKNRDVGIRITMAQAAIAKQAWVAAREALEDAARIDPKNAEVATLMESIRPNLPKPTTVPATNPAAVTPATTPVAQVPVRPPGAFTARRPVTPAEINRIRQIEVRADEKIPVRIDPDTKRKFLAASTDTSSGEFNKMSAEEQADLILTKGREDLHKGVLFTTDPASVAEFKTSVLKIVKTSCATNCHTGPKAGYFALYPDTANNAAVYTDFLVLQKYSGHVKGVERAMIDRDYPDSSLLLQYLLEPGISDAPHPDVPGFHAAIKKKEDPRYTKILHWIQGLKPIKPQYGIDLSTEAGAGNDSHKPTGSTAPQAPANGPPKVFAK